MDETLAKELRKRDRARYRAEMALTSFVLDLIIEGHKPAEIAKELGWSRQRMHSWLRSRRV